ncbi:MAG: hypothetical protein ACLQVD_07800 [Capsulimonadaceae bacterium]
MRKIDKRQVPVVFVMAVVLSGFATGCAHHFGMTQVQQIQNDRSLTDEQRSTKLQNLYYSIAGAYTTDNDQDIRQKLTDAGFEEGQPSSANVGSMIVGVVGVLLLVGVVLLQRNQDSPLAAGALGVLSSLPSIPAWSAKPEKKAFHPRAPQPTTPPVTAAAAGPVKPEIPIPKNQAEVDALPFDKRGASFFTSRPMPSEALCRTYITLGDRQNRINATHQEAEMILRGESMRVWSFTIDGVTAPWYAWEEYNPFDSYMAAREGEWRPGGRLAISCWLPVEDCDPSLDGYYVPSSKSQPNKDVEAPSADAVAENSVNVMPDMEGTADAYDPNKTVEISSAEIAQGHSDVVWLNRDGGIEGHDLLDDEDLLDAEGDDLFETAEAGAVS